MPGDFENLERSFHARNVTVSNKVLGDLFALARAQGMSVDEL